MKSIDYDRFLQANRSFKVAWWIWLGPLLLLPVVLACAELHGFIAQLLWFASQSAIMPGLVMAFLSWAITRNGDFLYKANEALFSAIAYGMLVAASVYLLYDPNLSQVLMQADSIDKFIFLVLLVLFSTNLGLAAVISLGLLSLALRKFLRAG